MLQWVVVKAHRPHLRDWSDFTARRLIFVNRHIAIQTENYPKSKLKLSSVEATSTHR
jgi:hypothetical protein